MNTDHFFIHDRVPSRVECGNRECVRGGYNLIEILDPLIRARIEEKEGHVACRGYEKIGVGTRSCVMMATYKVKIKYKQSEG